MNNVQSLSSYVAGFAEPIADQPKPKAANLQSNQTLWPDLPSFVSSPNGVAEESKTPVKPAKQRPDIFLHIGDLKGEWLEDSH
jgi:hypothetical protein